MTRRERAIEEAARAKVSREFPDTAEATRGQKLQPLGTPAAKAEAERLDIPNNQSEALFHAARFLRGTQ